MQGATLANLPEEITRLAGASGSRRASAVSGALAGAGGSAWTSAVSGALAGASDGRWAFPVPQVMRVLTWRPDEGFGVTRARPEICWTDDLVDLAEALLCQGQRTL
jgi:hypothetical protein